MLQLRNGPNEELASIERLHAQTHEHYGHRNIRAYYATSIGTHIAINRAAHNPALTHTWDHLYLQVQALRYHRILIETGN